MSVRLRATVVVEYDADPGDYGTDDPQKMAVIDRENWEADPLMFSSSFDDNEYRITVEPA